MASSNASEQHTPAETNAYMKHAITSNEVRPDTLVFQWYDFEGIYFRKFSVAPGISPFISLCTTKVMLSRDGRPLF